MEQVKMFDIYRYKVTISKDVEYKQWQDITNWCRLSIKDDIDSNQPTWRQCLPGSPSISDPDFSSWLFVRKEDAVLFELTWNYINN